MRVCIVCLLIFFFSNELMGWQESILYNSDNFQSIVSTEIPQGSLEDEVNIDSTSKIDNSNQSYSYSISPILGYTSDLGIIIGGAFFLYTENDPGSYFDVRLMIGFDPFNFQFLSSYKKERIFKNTDFEISGSYTTFFESYFGEGSNTDVDDYMRIYGSHYSLNSYLRFFINDKFSVTGGFDFRGRVESSVRMNEEKDVILKDTNNVNIRLFPDENTLALNLGLHFDDRDNIYSTTKGSLHEIDVSYVPSLFSNLDIDNGSLQIEAESRWFKSLFLHDLVLAGRIAGGYSLNEPSYLYRYKLGGSDVLRGYYHNRFRGKYYYVLQAEIRYPIWKSISGVVFADIGDITDNDFKTPKFCYGPGLRFGLPPDYLIKVRLDIGFASDQWSIFFTFGQSF